MMSSQARVQEYLKKHKIGTLFETLMAKLIKDQPDQPISYLVGVLQIKAEQRGERVRSGSPVRSRTRTPDQLTKSMPSQSAWAATDSLAVVKERGSDKTRKTNTMRSTKFGTEQGSPTRKSKPEWDNKVKVTELDDIWGDSKIVSKPRTNKFGQASSPTRQGVSAWGTGDEEEDLAYYNHGYSGPRGRKETGDPLAGEFPVGKAEKTTKTVDTKASYGRMKGQKNDAMKHKRALEKKILEMKQVQHDSGIEEDRDLVQDNAVELMEDANELRKEGCWNVKQSGVRLSKSQRSRRQEDESQVRVSICAHCAKVMSGGEPSEPGDGGFVLPDCDYDTDRAFDSRPASARFSQSPGVYDDEDDEEFESVSQVTGPRRVPAWQQKDPEATTPRKGKHMFNSNMSPSKGRPMYSSGKPKTNKNTRFGTSSLRSDDFASSPEPDMRKTWSPAGREDLSEAPESARTEKTKQVETARTDRTEQSEHLQSHRTDQDHTEIVDPQTKKDDLTPAPGGSTVADRSGWQVNEYDSDSSTFLGGGASKKKYQSRAY